jgi:hypothetical protein
VTASTPEALAAAMRRVMDDRHETMRMGESAARQASAMTWHDAIQQLLLPAR